jgi:hypothetical protein
VHETIEGETIVMNLKNGYYYSFDGIGPAVWELIINGFELENMVDFISDLYSSTNLAFREEIISFIEELKSHEIIFEKEEAGTDENHKNIEDLKQLKVFSEITVKKPLFQRYTDMRDVLLLDPIHDVDEKGWPEPKIRKW